MLFLSTVLPATIPATLTTLQNPLCLSYFQSLLFLPSYPLQPSTAKTICILRSIYQNSSVSTSLNSESPHCMAITQADYTNKEVTNYMEQKHKSEVYFIDSCNV